MPPMTAGRAAAIVDPAAVEALDVGGATAQLLTPPGPDDEPCLLRGTIPPGVVVPLHSHPDPETFVAISGLVEALVTAPEGPRWLPVRPGDVVHVPGGARHAWRNRAAEPSVALVVTTGRLGRFFREVGAPIPAGAAPAWPPSAETMGRLAAAAARHGHWAATPAENAAAGIELPDPTP